MSNNNNILLPSSLSQPHLEIFDVLMKMRLDSIQIDKILVYLIESVDSKALYYLAEQFDLLGHKGWKLADTDEKKRRLIKNAIELHRYKGTVYAIRKALSALGYPDVTITEHITHWATFKIDLNIGNTQLTQQQYADILEVVNEYKNVRSHFWGILFEVTFDEDVIVLEDDSAEGETEYEDDGIFVGGDFRYNGEHYYDGSKNYSSDTDVLTITIL